MGACSGPAVFGLTVSLSGKIAAVQQVGKGKRAHHFRRAIGDRWWARRKGAFAQPRIRTTRYVECTACGASYLCASQDDSIAGTRPTMP
jgi:hypothetical protein